jgi:hypothetical protein
VGKTLASPI